MLSLGSRTTLKKVDLSDISIFSPSSSRNTVSGLRVIIGSPLS